MTFGTGGAGAQRLTFGSPARLQRVRESQVPVLFKPVVASALLQAMAELAARKPAAEPSTMDA